MKSKLFALVALSLASLPAMAQTELVDSTERTLAAALEEWCLELSSTADVDCPGDTDDLRTEEKGGNIIPGDWFERPARWLGADNIKLMTVRVQQGTEVGTPTPRYAILLMELNGIEGATATEVGTRQGMRYDATPVAVEGVLP